MAKIEKPARKLFTTRRHPVRRSGSPAPRQFSSSPVRCPTTGRAASCIPATFGKKLPASTLVAVSALAHPDWLIEVEAIAVI